MQTLLFSSLGLVIALQAWAGFSILAQTGGFPIEQLIANGGTIGVIVAIVFWFVTLLNKIRDDTEKRIAEIVRASADSEAKLRNDHKDELKRRDEQHANEQRELADRVMETQREVSGLMRTVITTIAVFQQRYGISVPPPNDAKNGG